MVTKLLVISAAIILLGAVTESTAQYRHSGGYGYGYGHQSHPYYQQQRPGYGYPQQPVYPQQQQQLPPGVSVQEAEWVCKNPKTGDMLIISSEDLPTNAGNNGQPQQPNYPQPQPTFPQINPQPTLPPPTPSYPTQQPQQPSTGAPNTNGEGLIEIRAID